MNYQNIDDSELISHRHCRLLDNVRVTDYSNHDNDMEGIIVGAVDNQHAIKTYYIKPNDSVSIREVPSANCVLLPSEDNSLFQTKSYPFTPLFPRLSSFNYALAFHSDLSKSSLRRQIWYNLLFQYSDIFVSYKDNTHINDFKDLYKLLKYPLPVEARAHIWSRCVNLNYFYKPLLYQTYLSQKDTIPATEIHIILSDINRTEYLKMCQPQYTMSLQNILMAYYVHNPHMGYCQGMNYLATYLLTLFDEEEAFWMFSILIEHVLQSDFYSNPTNAIIDESVAYALLERVDAKLGRRINEIKEDNNMITGCLMNWFISIFSANFPDYFFFHAWDCILILGEHFILLTVLSILCNFNGLLGNLPNYSGLLKQLQKIPDYFDPTISTNVLNTALQYYLIVPYSDIIVLRSIFKRTQNQSKTCITYSSYNSINSDTSNNDIHRSLSDLTLNKFTPFESDLDSISTASLESSRLVWDGTDSDLESICSERSTLNKIPADSSSSFQTYSDTNTYLPLSASYTNVSTNNINSTSSLSLTKTPTNDQSVLNNSRRSNSMNHSQSNRETHSKKSKLHSIQESIKSSVQSILSKIHFTTIDTSNPVIDPNFIQFNFSTDGTLVGVLSVDIIDEYFSSIKLTEIVIE